MNQESEPVWTMTRGRYQALQGVHRPFIGEVSGLQLSRMGKRARKEYDEKRGREWQASADCAAEYARLCFEAAEENPEILKDPRLSADAKSAIWGERVRIKKAEVKDRLAALTAQNMIKSAEELEIGDRVYTLMGGHYLRVVKKYKASFRGVDDQGREHKVRAASCQWLHYNELVEAAEQGRTSPRPERAS